MIRRLDRCRPPLAGDVGAGVDHFRRGPFAAEVELRVIVDGVQRIAELDRIRDQVGSDEQGRDQAAGEDERRAATPRLRIANRDQRERRGRQHERGRQPGEAREPARHAGANRRTQ
jgi:hypothetical protein